MTALELDLFTGVGDGAGTAAAAAKMGTDPRATEMLLNALAAIGLLVKQDDVFRNTPVSARYFCGTSPDNVRPALLHTAHFWPRWSNLTDCVRAGTAVAQESNIRGEEWTEAFIAAMHRNASERAPLVIRAVDAAGTSNVGRGRRLQGIFHCVREGEFGIDCRHPGRGPGGCSRAAIHPVRRRGRSPLDSRGAICARIR